MISNTLVARRIIIVSDTLPVAVVTKEPEEVSSLRSSIAELSFTRSGRRRRDSFGFHCDPLDISTPTTTNYTTNTKANTNTNTTTTTTNHSGHANLTEFELVERHNHVAHWISSNLYGAETIIKIGKPSGIEPLDYSSPEMQSLLRMRYWDHSRCVPIFPSERLHKGHLEGYCRTNLWPLLHYVMWGNIGDGQVRDWENYQKANEAFCEAVLQVYQPGDVVWVLDYHLMILPALLRARKEEMVIGMFIRSPFPSSELFRCLPRKL